MKANLFLVAAPRSGSTQMASILSTHADIALSFVKEPNYFSNDEFSESYVKNTHLNDLDPTKIHKYKNKKDHSFQFAIFRREEDYQELFSGMQEKYRVDASTTYLHNPESPEKIRKYNPEAKVIILLREPISRLVSHYRLAHRTGRPHKAFEEQLEYEHNNTQPKCSHFLLRQSLYHQALRKYLESFPKESIKIVLFENFIKSPASTMAEIAEFLKIPKDGFNTQVNEQNESLSPRFTAINKIISRTGIKTALRSVLSKKIKSKLKSLYFSEQRLHVEKSKLTPYRSTFENDRQKTEELVPEIKTWRTFDEAIEN